MEEEEVGQDKTLFRQDGEQSAYRKKKKKKRLSMFFQCVEIKTGTCETKMGLMGLMGLQLSADLRAIPR